MKVLLVSARTRKGRPTIDRYLSHKALLEEYLAGLTFSDDPRLANVIGAMRYSLLTESERLRPVLCVEAANSLGLAPEKILPSAAAIELVHTLSSIHDELPALGGGEVDRRMPTCREKYGEATAILAGDGFFGESLALVARHQEGTSERLLMVVRELAQSTGVEGMVGGQALHFARGEGGADLETLEVAHTYKTGWDASNIGVYFSSVIYSNTFYALSYPLIALSRYRRSGLTS